ncbi:RsbT antagonist protein RsbS [compost metagenome]
MEVPIHKQGDFLVASIPATLSDDAWKRFQHALIAQITSQRSQGVLIDVTALDVLDSFATRILRNTTQMAKLRGAVSVIVGIQPEVALSMVQLGLTSRLQDVLTALDVEGGFAQLEAWTGGRGHGFG